MPTSERVLSWAKITRRQLDNWVDKGYIKPTIVAGRGYMGAQYDWTMAEAKMVQRIAELTRGGLAPALAAQLARGDKSALDTLLHALAPCLWQLRWQHAPEYALHEHGYDTRGAVETCD